MPRARWSRSKPSWRVSPRGSRSSTPGARSTGCTTRKSSGQAPGPRGCRLPACAWAPKGLVCAHARDRTAWDTDRTGYATVTGRRVTTREAAEALGISVEAVRKRIERDQLKHERVDNRVYVYLDEERTKSGLDVEGKGAGALVESLQDQVSYLREQLAEERRANDENRRLLLAAPARIPTRRQGAA